MNSSRAKKNKTSGKPLPVMSTDSILRTLEEIRDTELILANIADKLGSDDADIKCTPLLKEPIMDLSQSLFVLRKKVREEILPIVDIKKRDTFEIALREANKILAS